MNVTFGPRTYELLSNLAQESGKTKADVIRDSLHLQEYITRKREEGGTFLIEEHGRTMEIMFVR